MYLSLSLSLSLRVHSSVDADIRQKEFLGVKKHVVSQ